MAAPPDVVAFDAVETLFSLTSLEPRLVEAGGSAATLPLWFARLLAHGFAITAASDYRSYREIAKASLQAVLPDARDQVLDHVVAGLAQLDAHPDAAPAMGRCVEGARVIVLTNGSRRGTQKLLERGGLDAFSEAVVSAEDVGTWKPAPAAYLRAADTAGVQPEALGLVTVHSWDVHGAHRAGLTTGWCSRLEGRFGSVFDRPDVGGATLLDVVEGLFTLQV